MLLRSSSPNRNTSSSPPLESDTHGGRRSPNRMKKSKSEKKRGNQPPNHPSIYLYHSTTLDSLKLPEIPRRKPGTSPKTSSKKSRRLLPNSQGGSIFGYISDDGSTITSKSSAAKIFMDTDEVSFIATAWENEENDNYSVGKGNDLESQLLLANQREEDLKIKLIRLKADKEIIQNRIAASNPQTRGKESGNYDLEKDCEKLHEEVNYLTKELKNLQDALTASKERCSSLENDVTRMESLLRSSEERASALETKLFQLEASRSREEHRSLPSIQPPSHHKIAEDELSAYREEIRNALAKFDPSLFEDLDDPYHSSLSESDRAVATSVEYAGAETNEDVQAIRRLVRYLKIAAHKKRQLEYEIQVAAETDEQIDEQLEYRHAAIIHSYMGEVSRLVALLEEQVENCHFLELDKERLQSRLADSDQCFAKVIKEHQESLQSNQQESERLKALLAITQEDKCKIEREAAEKDVRIQEIQAQAYAQVQKLTEESRALSLEVNGLKNEVQVLSQEKEAIRQRIEESAQLDAVLDEQMEITHAAVVQKWVMETQRLLALLQEEVTVRHFLEADKSSLQSRLSEMDRTIVSMIREHDAANKSHKEEIERLNRHIQWLSIQKGAAESESAMKDLERVELQNAHYHAVEKIAHTRRRSSASTVMVENVIKTLALEQHFGVHFSVCLLTQQREGFGEDRRRIYCVYVAAFFAVEATQVNIIGVDDTDPVTIHTAVSGLKGSKDAERICDLVNAKEGEGLLESVRSAFGSSSLVEGCVVDVDNNQTSPVLSQKSVSEVTGNTKSVRETALEKQLLDLLNYKDRLESQLQLLKSGDQAVNSELEEKYNSLAASHKKEITDLAARIKEQVDTNRKLLEEEERMAQKIATSLSRVRELEEQLVVEKDQSQKLESQKNAYDLENSQLQKDIQRLNDEIQALKDETRSESSKSESNLINDRNGGISKHGEEPANIDPAATDSTDFGMYLLKVTSSQISSLEQQVDVLTNENRELKALMPSTSAQPADTDDFGVYMLKVTTFRIASLEKELQEAIEEKNTAAALLSAASARADGDGETLRAQLEQLTTEKQYLESALASVLTSALSASNTEIKTDDESAIEAKNLEEKVVKLESDNKYLGEALATALTAALRALHSESSGDSDVEKDPINNHSHSAEEIERLISDKQYLEEALAKALKEALSKRTEHGIGEMESKSTS